MSKSKKLKSLYGSSSIKELSQWRIITKNLVYVIGLSQNISTKETLSQYEYFGQYGQILKIVINKKRAYNPNHPYGPSYSAYVTYSSPSEASIAILALDNTIIDNHLIRASFGTTKYCSFFLKRMECTNKECLFLHQKANESDIIKREDLNVRQSIFYEQQLYAIKISDIYNQENKNKLITQGRSRKTIFPSTDMIYQNEIVIKNGPIVRKNNIKEGDKGSLNSNPNTKKKVFIEDNSNREDYGVKGKNTRNAPGIKLEISSIKSSRDDISTGDEKVSSKEIEENLCNYNTKRIKSRFDFAIEEKEKEGVEVPNCVEDIINKRFKYGMYLKYFKDFDKLILKAEVLNEENDWTQFFKDNTNKNKDNPSLEKDDFISLFENINDFILTNININN